MEAMTASVRSKATPIRQRIAILMEDGGLSSAALAERTGLERSTISRLLRGDRQPSVETLELIAPVLGMTLEQLVLGTDAEARISEGRRLIAREHYDNAVNQFIEIQRANDDLRRQMRDRDGERDAMLGELRALRARLVDFEHHEKELSQQRDRALGDAAHHEQAADRYREALRRAVADLATVKSKIGELEEALKAGNKTGKIAAVLAGIAATVSVASYFTDHEKPKAPRKPTST